MVAKLAARRLGEAPNPKADNNQPSLNFQWKGFYNRRYAKLSKSDKIDILIRRCRKAERALDKLAVGS